MYRENSTDSVPPIAFEDFETLEVNYIGLPYQAKLVNGVWYFKGLDDRFRQFAFQAKVNLDRPMHSQEL